MPDDFADIDPKTRAVFNKKGYKITTKLGSGAFGQVRVFLIFLLSDFILLLFRFTRLRNSRPVRSVRLRCSI